MANCNRYIVVKAVKPSRDLHREFLSPPVMFVSRWHVQALLGDSGSQLENVVIRFLNIYLQRYEQQPRARPTVSQEDCFLRSSSGLTIQQKPSLQLHAQKFKVNTPRSHKNDNYPGAILCITQR